MSSQLWVRMVGYRNYISSTYNFISYFVSLIKYAGRKLNNIMWLYITRYLNYITYRYAFISYFVSLTKYVGQKPNNLMWLRIVGEFMSIYIVGYGLSSQLWLRMAGYRNYISSTNVFISYFVSLTKYTGRKLNNLMWLRMAGDFMSIP